MLHSREPLSIKQRPPRVSVAFPAAIRDLMYLYGGEAVGMSDVVLIVYAPAMSYHIWCLNETVLDGSKGHALKR